MIFKNLEDKCLYYRGLNDNRLMPNVPVLVMVDGRGFSKLIKNHFNKPFDDDFISIMNDVAKTLCEKVQGVKCAYVQSDEISLLLDDSVEGDLFFGGRLCKMLSIIPSIATARFQQLMIGLDVAKEDNDIMGAIINSPLYQFDCKVWTVPNKNDAYAWFLYRQIDCVKNSKQQTAQTYCSHKSLLNKDADEQITFLKEQKGIDWNTDYDDGKKYGRFIVKRPLTQTKYIPELKKTVEYTRDVWSVENAYPLFDEGNKEKFLEMVPALK